MNITRNSEFKEFWDAIDEAAKEVATWPCWKVDKIIERPDKLEAK
jgi:hypothetical protein